MENPVVKVTKLEKRPDSSFGPTASLGGVTTEQFELQIVANLMLARIAGEAKAIFLLEWEGNKIPRDAEINGKKVGWTQNGLVVGTNGEDIGTYERLVEFGGPSRKEQKMLVFVN